MKVTFKTITQGTFVLDVNEDQTIQDIKNAIASSKGEANFPACRQNLIYNGKVLEDDATFDSINYDAKKFLVVIIKAEKVAPNDSKAVEGTSAEKAIEAAAADVAGPTTEVIDTSDLSAEDQQKLQNLADMGYPKSEALSALRAAFFIQSRAVEYLIGGIPEDAKTPPQKAESSSIATTAAAAAPDVNDITQSELFSTVREILQVNPNMLPEIVGQISRDNPEMLQSIRGNEAELLAALNLNAAPSRPPRNQTDLVVDVTEEENEVIERLKAMGFPEQLVIEAYLTCDKNEELAINYILARMNE